MITIMFARDNAAFGDDEIGAALETARILRDLADKFEAGDNPLVVRDINGNKVGTVTYSD